MVRLLKTEEVLGSYDLHDFFLYQMLRHHDEPKKIYDLACVAFKDVEKETIKKAIVTFYQSFLYPTIQKKLYARWC